MSTDYAGDATNNPATIAVLDDGDPPSAATIAPALEGLMDKIVHTQASGVTQSGFAEVSLPRSADEVTGTTWTLVHADAVLDFTLKAGDRVFVDASFEHRSDTALSESQVRIEIVGPGTDYAGAHAVNASTSNENSSRTARFTVDADGDFEVKLMHRASAGGVKSSVTHWQIRAFVHRATS